VHQQAGACCDEGGGEDEEQGRVVVSADDADNDDSSKDEEIEADGARPGSGRRSRLAAAAGSFSTLSVSASMVIGYGGRPAGRSAGRQ